MPHELKLPVTAAAPAGAPCGCCVPAITPAAGASMLLNPHCMGEGGADALAATEGDTRSIELRLLLRGL